ncbi:type VI secretion system baseplate subunit TssG [Paralimibaculum aggregatum]|uniref:Type VI secretion system baseplate subunit TssG n=1 Tax=Paralimibaculum aggregatum TaxID=3036245 RepID=A0ABQ6LIW9_9RHOB|nr:type VI secretion system baseplate subunit TssG [Limibaculum sp. NKW23]GMG81607.1 type VI secretion system baseplate subunit TssG [Limibaculum sp. NKW23]
MASEERRAPLDLTRLDALAKEPEVYHFFQAIRLIEAAHLDKPRLGRSRRPEQDPVRLGQDPELAFPPSTVRSFVRGKDGAPDRLIAHVLGLWGPHGPLPLHLTEYAHNRKYNHRDHTLVAFANMFHHRMISLFYRAWASAEPAPNFDRHDDDPFAAKVAAVAGIKGAALADRDALPDVAKYNFSGRFSHGPRNEEGLLAIISHFFGAKVSIESFVGSYLYLDKVDLFAMGGRRPKGRLGRSITVGERVWSRQAKFRVRIGPLSLRGYRRLLPGGESLRRLVSIVRNYHGDQLDWEVSLVLKADEVPRAILGQQGELGWTTWLGERKSDTDAEDMMLAPQLYFDRDVQQSQSPEGT